MGERAASGAITTALSTRVRARRDHVWLALCTPADRLRWDPALLSLLEAPEDYPAVGQQARWRCRQGSVTVILRDRPVEIIAGARLRSEVALGLFRFVQTWTLHDEAGDTRVGLQLAARSSIAVVGGTVDRFDVRRLAAEYVDSRLRGLREWCELPAPAQPHA